MTTERTVSQTYREFRGECECDWPDEDTRAVTIEMDSRSGVDVICGRCDRLVPEDLAVAFAKPVTFVARVRTSPDVTGEYATVATLRP